jgi:nucleotide-binding universal stress UspA family protein
MIMTNQIATPHETSGRPTLLTRPVLLADDGSEDADLARRVAADLAAPAGLPLHVVSAWQLPTAQVAPFTTLPANAWEVYEQSARTVQEGVQRQLASLGATAVSGHVGEGMTADVIVHTAESIGAALIIIGSHGRGPLTSHVLGSVADQVIHTVRWPVLVARGDATSWPPHAIIIGDSPSIESLPAARLGALLAGVLGIPVTLVRALSVDGTTPAEADSTSRASAGGELSARAARVQRETGVPVSSQVVAGDPADVLLGLATQTKPPALITVARRPHHPLGMGSVTASVLHHAAGPVLVVPALAFDR